MVDGEEQFGLSLQTLSILLASFRCLAMAEFVGVVTSAQAEIECHAGIAAREKMTDDPNLHWQQREENAEAGKKTGSKREKRPPCRIAIHGG